MMTELSRYTGKRLLQLIPVLFGVTLLVYALMYFSPGDPAQKKLTAGGVAVSQEVLDAARKNMGISQSFPVQYGRWLLGALRGMTLQEKGELTLADRVEWLRRWSAELEYSEDNLEALAEYL